jgi:hypothetical protein
MSDLGSPRQALSQVPHIEDRIEVEGDSKQREGKIKRADRKC